MEARIEAVEEELRLEKRKNAALERQSRLSASLNPAESCQDILDLATDSQSSADGNEVKASSGSDDSLKNRLKRKKGCSQGGFEVTEKCKMIFL